MITSAAGERRELAHRTCYGIEVTLLWTQSTNIVTVVVVDMHAGEELEFEVNGSCALEAFNHPYAYAAADGVHSRQATRPCALRH